MTWVKIWSNEKAAYVYKNTETGEIRTTKPTGTTSTTSGGDNGDKANPPTTTNTTPSKPSGTSGGSKTNTDADSIWKSYVSLFGGKTPPLKRTSSQVQALIKKGVASDWNAEQVAQYVRTNLESVWLKTTIAMKRGKEIKYYLYSFFDDLDTKERKLLNKMIGAYAKADWQVSDLESFLQNTVMKSSLFKRDYAGFSGFAKANSGMSLAQQMQLYKQTKDEYATMYKTWMGDADAKVNMELINQAMAKGWSKELFTIEFKQNDPNYSKTGEYKSRETQFGEYWQQLFGTESQMDSFLKDKYIKSMFDAPDKMLNDIKETSEFKLQYGNWDDFVAAQDELGNTAQILENPQLYKIYKEGLRQAFNDVGMDIPDGWDKTFYKSGLTGDEIKSNVRQFVTMEQSQQFMTGEKTDMQTAVGLGDKKAGGDLRTRMNKALAKHRAYGQTREVGPRVEETEGSKFITQRI